MPDTITAPQVPEAVREVAEEFRKAVRTAGEAYLDASDGVLEALVEYQEKLQNDVDQKWLADAVGKQADLTRQLIKLNADQRDRLAA